MMAFALVAKGNDAIGVEQAFDVHAEAYQFEVSLQSRSGFVQPLRFMHT